MKPFRRLLSSALPLLVIGSAAVAAPDFWESRPIRIIQTLDANFPPGLLNAGVRTGEVRAVLNVDADGKLADLLVTAYTHRELAVTFADTVRAWEFEAARDRGRPVGARVELTFLFEARGSVLSLSSTDLLGTQLARSQNDAWTVSVCRASELDEPLRTVQRVAPRHPGKAMKPVQLTGRVNVDFYVDADGRPRMPVVLRATDEAFALAAVEALEQWRFAPPLREGRPVLVRVAQEFIFASGSGT